jgi:hypothetical protein
VPWVNPHSDVESVLSSQFGEVLVSANTGSFKSLTGKLFLFIRNHVHAKRKIVYVSLLSSKIINSQFSIRYTTTISRFDVRLSSLPSIAGKNEIDNLSNTNNKHQSKQSDDD